MKQHRNPWSPVRTNFPEDSGVGISSVKNTGLFFRHALPSGDATVGEEITNKQTAAQLGDAGSNSCSPRPLKAP